MAVPGQSGVAIRQQRAWPLLSPVNVEIAPVRLGNDAMKSSSCLNALRAQTGGETQPWYWPPYTAVPFRPPLRVDAVDDPVRTGPRLYNPSMPIGTNRPASKVVDEMSLLVRATRSVRWRWNPLNHLAASGRGGLR